MKILTGLSRCLAHRVTAYNRSLGEQTNATERYAVGGFLLFVMFDVKRRGRPAVYLGKSLCECFLNAVRDGKTEF